MNFDYQTRLKMCLIRIFNFIKIKFKISNSNFKIYFGLMIAYDMPLDSLENHHGSYCIQNVDLNFFQRK